MQLSEKEAELKEGVSEIEHLKGKVHLLTNQLKTVQKEYNKILSEGGKTENGGAVEGEEEVSRVEILKYLKYNTTIISLLLKFGNN